MPEKPLSLPITRPISVWNKPLKADFKDFFKALSKAAVHGVTGEWDELASDAVDALSAVGLESDAAQLAWLLVRRALAEAIYDLVFESAHLITGRAEDGVDELCDGLDLSLEAAELKLDGDLFERPGDLSILEQLKAPLGQWLRGNGLTKHQASGVTGRLRTYFVYALHREWIKNGKRYATIKEAMDTPFLSAGEHEQSWARYDAWLQRQVNEGMMDETFGLADVYVPLRAYCIEKITEDGASASEPTIGEETPHRDIVVDLEGELNTWLAAGDRRDAVRVVSGGPGSGKSSFAKIFAAHVTAERHTRVLFVPLHQFDISGDLTEAVGAFVRATGLLPANPLDPETGEKRLLIIFDGLDELSRQGKVASEISQHFVVELQRTVERRNAGDACLQVLITGRELSIQSSSSQFRKPRQVLHILAYSTPQKERDEWHDPGKLLARDQRDEWWKYYGRCTGRGYESMPEELRRDGLDEITSQPLLNYLVALTFVRGRLDFSEDVNLNVVYRNLLEAVYERAYAGHTHRAIVEMDSSSFVRILEEIGLAAWHGDGRTTTVGEIERHCEGSGLSRFLEVFQEGAKAGVTRLLTAFYFRQHGRRQGGDPTFEFTHKSFGEYLTARRIVRALRRMRTELDRREEDPDTGWDRRDALRHWAEVCGPTAMDEYLQRLLGNEVRIAKDVEPAMWQATLCDLIGFMLKHGMPMEQLANRPTYFEESRQARNAEEALLVTLHACACVTRKTSSIDWPDDTSAGAWIKRLQGQRTGEENVLALGALGHLNLDGCALHQQDLFGAELSFVHANESMCVSATFWNANLDGAQFRNAVLTKANFENATLKEANLQNADLENANLQGADLRGANLDGAKLNGAVTTGAKGLERKVDD